MTCWRTWCLVVARIEEQVIAIRRDLDRHFTTEHQEIDESLVEVQALRAEVAEIHVAAKVSRWTLPRSQGGWRYLGDGPHPHEVRREKI